MNSKAIKRQLLAAIAMVLVAAIALGSSTYAWFVASGNVTATGMNVKAQAEAGLVIRYNTNNQWGTTAEGTKTKTQSAALNPTSTINGKTWYHANATYASGFAANALTRDTITTGFEGYYLVEDFYIRSAMADKPVNGLYVPSVTVSTKAVKPISTALRVGIMFTAADNSTTLTPPQDVQLADKFIIFAPVKIDDDNQPTYSYNVYTTKASDTDKTQVTALATGTTTGDVNSIVVPNTITIPGSSTGNGVKVSIYVWYEGEDESLYSDNYAVENLSVSVNFTAVPESA